jgi:hypothetical protein
VVAPPEVSPFLILVSEYNLEDDNDTSATASDPQDGRDQPLAKGSEPPNATPAA